MRVNRDNLSIAEQCHLVDMSIPDHGDPIAKVFADVNECLLRAKRELGKAPQGLLEPLVYLAKYPAAYGVPQWICRTDERGRELGEPALPLVQREWYAVTSRGWPHVAEQCEGAMRAATLLLQDEAWNKAPTSDSTARSRSAVGAEVMEMCYLAESFGDGGYLN